MKTETTTTASCYDGELNDIQSKLLQNIGENPGIRYRELLRLTHLANGVLTYHLALLQKLDQVKVERNKSKMTRYYPNNISTVETGIIGYIRNHATRQIVLLLLERDLCSFDEIVEHTKKAPSTISWHLKRLKEAGIVSVQRRRYQFYKVTNKEVVAEVLYKYRQSFIDKVVENYTEIMDEL